MVTFSGVPIVGGMVICGRTGWILFVTNTPLTREVIKLDLPVPSSPQTQMRTSPTLVGFMKVFLFMTEIYL